ncbi:uncharacterized protein UV8b_01167 [Ustilaginoidea virens]|uniref:Uncharacterized protein n=1 Tax=Ustilaginoidea virens TaxID=1159556 RepID=A0A8E5MEZ9_USTVR|nr:uncharacterized protein UV8b_01167 [Ustilaginoidea virens]QUC16926.1 hypothetical protein UV8b_01167 [Ustilaginoidea virens]
MAGQSPQGRQPGGLRLEAGGGCWLLAAGCWLLGSTESSLEAQVGLGCAIGLTLDHWLPGCNQTRH